MKLSELFDSVPPDLDCVISDVVSDSRQLKKNCVFVAIRGTRHDGHEALAAAVATGAVGLVVEDESRVPAEYRGFIATVSSTRRALARLSSIHAGRPSENLFTVGVTGTNGKTTTTHIVEAVLNAGGFPTGVIGTNGHHLGTRRWETEMTTPDAPAIQNRLRDFSLAGARAVAMEVSSHAIDQARADSIEFDVAIFSNLTRDHLDYHGTMEAYFSAKFRLFDELLRMSKKSKTFAIFNADDEWCERAALELGKIATNDRPMVWRFGQSGYAADKAKTKTLDFAYEIHQQRFDGVDFTLTSPVGRHRILFPMPGLHNVQNAICAFATGIAAGIDVTIIVQALCEFSGVRGRLERVLNQKGVHVFVDYAHTDDGLRAILKTLNEIRKSSASSAKILTLFGCGGDRDRGKRPLMMRAALDGSDQVILTSDNPRTEDPEKILNDAMAEVTPREQSRVVREVNRRRAIEIAISNARAGDVVLIAGKGHEATQQIGTVKTDFSDVAVAREFLQN